MQSDYNLNKYTRNLTYCTIITSFYLIISLFSKSYNNIKYYNFSKIELASEVDQSFVEKNENYIKEIYVKSGDTLKSLINHAELNRKDSVKITDIIKTIYDPKKLSVGQKLIFTFDDTDIDRKFESLKIKIAYNREIEIYRNDINEFSVRNIDINFTKNIVRVKGKINNNLLSTANSLKIPVNGLKNIIKAYSYDIDFQRDIQIGDEIDVIYEKFYNEDGKFSHNGNIIYSSLILSDRKIDLYQYRNREGDVEYYNKDGINIQKELLKTPINIVKISSGFGPRKHPILGYNKMHKGVDFAAPIGTPIFAAGSGVIEEIGRKGTYGNYIRIRHKDNYATAYAHASSFNKNLKKGSFVKQGEIIAYVGNTGMSKGAHLHFETIVNGKQVNPMKMKMNSNKKLANSELIEFNKYKTKIASVINNTTNYSEITFK